MNLPQCLSIMGFAGIVMAQETPQFTLIQCQTNNEMRLQWSASATQLCLVETSSQLPNWSPMLSLISTGMNQHTDSAAPFYDTRFYRVTTTADNNAVTGDYLNTDSGSVIIHPINHATLVLSWNGTTIYADPVGGATRFKGLPRPDLILITHEHSDHFDPATLSAVKGTNTVILATKTVVNSLPATLKSSATLLTNGAKLDLLGLSIEAIPAYNLTSTFHPKGNGNGYILTMGGKRIYISGDTEDIPDMHSLKDIDVAFLCINRPYTMTVAQAVSAVKDFRPKVVYPYHYQGNPVTDLNSFKQSIGVDSGVEVRLRKWY